MSLHINEKYNNIIKYSEYEKKYIKYKKKYLHLKNLNINTDHILNKIIILPDEYNKLSNKYKNKFNIYEFDELNNPISYIKNTYPIKKTGGNSNTTTTTEEEHLQESILEKDIVSPNEYFVLSDTNKSKYEIGEYDYTKFPNRVVPKNYKKLIS